MVKQIRTRIRKRDSEPLDWNHQEATFTPWKSWPNHQIASNSPLSNNVVSSCVVGERMGDEGVSHGLNRDIPDEIRNFRVMKSGTSGFHSALAKNLEMRDLAGADYKFQVLRYP